VAIRSADEIAGIRRACRVGREVLDAAAAAVRPGVTTDEIDRVVSGNACMVSLWHWCMLCQQDQGFASFAAAEHQHIVLTSIQAAGFFSGMLLCISMADVWHVRPVNFAR
jgi:hypothetical protein